METPTPVPVVSQAPPATETLPTAVPAVSPTPPLPPDPPQRLAVPNGGALPSAHGLLFVGLETGTMEFWAIAGPYRARPVSRDGRWVVWTLEGVDGAHLLDTQTGSDRLVTVGGAPARVGGLSADARLLLAETADRVALLETESGRVLAEAPRPPGTFNGAAEFALDGSAAKGFGGDGAGPRTTLVLRPDGSTLAVDDATWPIRWSADGSRLAVTTAIGTSIVSASGRSRLNLQMGGAEQGYNLRWSPDGRYLAVANAYNVGGQRVFDAATGEEVLRTAGSLTCIGEYWFEDGTLEYGWEGKRVAVPSGDVRDGVPRSLGGAAYRFDQSMRTPGTTRLLLASGTTVEFRSEAPRSSYYDGDGVYGTTTDGRALFLVGIGGRGLCDGGLAELAVELPPFAQ